MNIKKYEKALADALDGGMGNDEAHEFATDQATRETSPPAPAGVHTNLHDDMLLLIQRAIDADDYGPLEWERWNNDAKTLVERAEGGDK